MARMQTNWNAYTSGGHINWFTFGKLAGRFYDNETYSYPTTQPLRCLGIFSREMNVYVHQDPCTVMLTGPLFIMAPNWEQLKCPSVGELKKSTVGLAQ